MIPRVLIVDDSLSIRESLSEMLKNEEVEVVCASNATEALGHIEMSPESFALALVDHNFKQCTHHLSRGDLICNEIKKINPDIATIILSGDKSTESYQLWVKSDIQSILFKPVSKDKILIHVNVAVERFHQLYGNWRKSKTEVCNKLKMIGPSVEFQEMGAMALKFAECSENVLLIGETGTGKELIAKAIHDNSSRCDLPYVVLDCAQFKDNSSLMASELFGHKKGAFTGADKDKNGIFEMANGGTVFLDEFHQLGREAQPKLLRVIQERAIRAVGATSEKKVDFRLICGVQPNIKEMVEESKFLSDLYFRVKTLSLDIPPLRERVDDIFPLVRHFQKKIEEKEKIPHKEIRLAALKKLKNYSWPGNIRELESVITNLYVKVDGNIIREPHLDKEIREYKKSADNFNSMTMKELEEFFLAQQKVLILKALKDNDQNVALTAKQLDMNRNSLNTKLRAFGLMNLEAEQREGMLASLIGRFGSINNMTH